MKKVMVVDDDSDVIYTVKECLKDYYNVVGFESGKEFFRKLELEIPDIILLDIMMPEMDGWQVIKRLKDNESLKDIPILIVSALKDNVVRNAGGFYAEEVIEKPFSREEILDKINSILDK